MARRRMCHEPGQHAPPTTETYAPGKEGTETTKVRCRLNLVELCHKQLWLEVAETQQAIYVAPSHDVTNVPMPVPSPGGGFG